MRNWVCFGCVSEACEDDVLFLEICCGTLRIIYRHCSHLAVAAAEEALNGLAFLGGVIDATTRQRWVNSWCSVREHLQSKLARGAS